MATGRRRHPKKEIEQAIQYAEEKRWRYRKAGKSAHIWGVLLCIEASRQGCRMNILSTPRSVEGHARQIRSRVDHCPHLREP